MEVSLQAFRKRFTYDPVKDLLGKGGFGEVYKAHDNEDNHDVALKISQGTADDKYNIISEIKRFKKLSHPNIVKHIEAYEVNTGSTDIHGKPILYHVGILEYADKGTLADLLKKGTPDYPLIEDLAKDIIEGLAYLHKENIIHRDLKPTNILLFSEGDKLRAKITDFGIAKRADATAASTQLVGTVEYMAPEYFTTSNITPASDVWSLGIMLLEALTGTHPFGKTSLGESNQQIISNILNKDIASAIQNITEPLKKIITDCLRKEPILRPQSAEVLKTQLTNLTTDSFGERTQVISWDKKPRQNKILNRRVIIVSGILAVLGAIYLIIYLGFQNFNFTGGKKSESDSVDFSVLIQKDTKEYKKLPSPQPNISEIQVENKVSSNQKDSIGSSGFRSKRFITDAQIEKVDKLKIPSLPKVISVMKKYVHCGNYSDIICNNGRCDFIIYEGNYKTINFNFIYFAEVDISKVYDDNFEMIDKKNSIPIFSSGKEPSLKVDVSIWVAIPNYYGPEGIFNGYNYQDNIILCGLNYSDYILIKGYFDKYYYRDNISPITDHYPSIRKQ
jgi:serine/threonine protein kinase